MNCSFIMYLLDAINGSSMGTLVNSQRSLLIIVPR
jgi:hypothetical protein